MLYDMFQFDKFLSICTIWYIYTILQFLQKRKSVMYILYVCHRRNQLYIYIYMYKYVTSITWSMLRWLRDLLLLVVQLSSSLVSDKSLVESNDSLLLNFVQQTPWFCSELFLCVWLACLHWFWLFLCRFLTLFWGGGDGLRSTPLTPSTPPLPSLSSELLLPLLPFLPWLDSMW